MELQAGQGESQCGSGGAQGQVQGILSGQGQNQGSCWGGSQGQCQAGTIVQIEGQANGCFGVQDQSQQASVYSGQMQTK
jgi:hypothetical protein